jgi:anthranilate phosphoribosyltransferase
MTPDLKYSIETIVGGGHLSREDAASAMGVIMDGGATDAQIGGFLAGLRVRGEICVELLGFLDAFRERAVRVRLDDPDAVDLCGTGGDGLGTINVSTIAAFVVAGAGVTVAKHGNRSVSSRSGSADLLRELGVNIDLSPERMESCINSTRLGFLFAPIYHPAMKYASGPRRELGVRTCFNLLGPLANPAGVTRQVVGTYSPLSAEMLASIFAEIRPASAAVLHSADGLDEVSPAGPTEIRSIGPAGAGEIRTVVPDSFGIGRRSALSDVAGGSPAENAAIALRVLAGEAGAARDFVVMNAAVGLGVARDGLSLPDAAGLCAESLDSGRASDALRRLVEYTNR